MYFIKISFKAHRWQGVIQTIKLAMALMKGFLYMNM